MKALLTLACLLLSTHAFGLCTILNSQGGPSLAQGDLLYQLLSPLKKCPKNILDLRALITSQGGLFKTTMVANRGFHNPGQGSFSLFEMMAGKFETLRIIVKPGDFFLGHFVEPDGNRLILAQKPSRGALMVELIAWDYSKNLFNFYELRGGGGFSTWFYRGDSADILSDITLLHRQPDPQHPVFGQRLRCSGCHTNGGPIMKELFAPHNDWWSQQRPLPLGGRVPEQNLIPFFKRLSNPELLAQTTALGVKKLQAPFSLSLQEMLRPLFCPLEINFVSDTAPAEAAMENLQVPSSFLVHPLFVKGQIQINRSAYLAQLQKLGSRFPETAAIDSDHGWLAPVKAYSDNLMIEKLLQSGVINEKWALAILSIDKGNPALSTDRCHLLRLVPQSLSQWQVVFVQNLKATPHPAAQKLARLLTEPYVTPQSLRRDAQKFLVRCQRNLLLGEGAAQWTTLLFQRRMELKFSEISKNPLGQILEPGFRVIFPEIPTPPRPGLGRVDDDCSVKFGAGQRHF